MNNSRSTINRFQNLSMPLLLFAGLFGFWSTGTADEGPCSDEIDALFAQWERTDTPGAAVGIVRGGEVVFKKGYGMASLEHETVISTSSVFDVASVSKQFTAMAIAVLARDGKIDLDDPVRQYISELHPFDPPIRIRHLVHHTSGLRDWPATLALAGWRMDDVISFDQILRMTFRQRTLNFEPGTEYLYSNTGYNLLAEIISRVTGQPFSEWMSENIFEPLGMKNTRFHDNHKRVVTMRVDSYAPDQETFRWQRNALTALGSSSLYSTVDDMILWINNFDSGCVGGADAIALMHQRGRLNNGEQIDYSFGQTIGSYRGLKVVDHTGSWAGFRSCLMRFPEQGLGIVILSNRADCNAVEKGRQLADLYLEEVMEAPRSKSEKEEDSEEKKAPELSNEKLAEFAGTYWSPELDAIYHLFVEEDQLKARHFVHGEFRLKPKRPDEFDGGLWFLRKIEVGRDALGRVSGFRASSHRARNVWFEKRR